MKWTEHGDGVFSKRYQSLDLNIGAVACDDGLLIIDTRAHHAQARELIEDLKAISKLPVKWVINTHHHWDHTFGNGEFHEADIWGHESCVSALADYGQVTLARLKKMAPAQAAAFDEVLILPPNRTVSDETTVTFGGRRIEMKHLGRGHTNNDLVVVIPEADVVFAGDLVENDAPPSFGDAYPLEWPTTVAALAELVTGPVIPGHGTPADREFVVSQQADLADTAELARKRHADGMTAEAAAATGGPFPKSTLEEAFGRAWSHLGEQT